MSQQLIETPLVEVDKIDVEEGFNPRTHMDPDALARLAGSLRKTDMVQPLTVRPTDDGRFVVIAGDRRLKAAEMAGIRKVPVHIANEATLAWLRWSRICTAKPRPDRHRPRAERASSGT